MPLIPIRNLAGSQQRAPLRVELDAEAPQSAFYLDIKGQLHLFSELHEVSLRAAMYLHNRPVGIASNPGTETMVAFQTRVELNDEKLPCSIPKDTTGGRWRICTFRALGTHATGARNGQATDLGQVNDCLRAKHGLFGVAVTAGMSLDAVAGSPACEVVKPRTHVCRVPHFGRNCR